MWREIARATVEHLAIVAIAVAVAAAAGVPLGILCARRGRLGRVVLRLIDIVQTIPSLALFGFLIPLPFIGGIGVRTMPEWIEAGVDGIAFGSEIYAPDRPAADVGARAKAIVEAWTQARVAR